MLKNIKKWFEIIRAKTLLVSMASVIMAIALAFENGGNQWLPAILCLLFAVLAQATSNVVNDYTQKVEALWVENLRKKYQDRVIIYNDVLETLK